MQQTRYPQLWWNSSSAKKVLTLLLQTEPSAGIAYGKCFTRCLYNFCLPDHGMCCTAHAVASSLILSIAVTASAKTSLLKKGLGAILQQLQQFKFLSSRFFSIICIGCSMWNAPQLTYFASSTCGTFCKQSFALYEPVLLYAKPAIFLRGSNTKSKKLANRFWLSGAEKRPYSTI